MSLLAQAAQVAEQVPSGTAEIIVFVLCAAVAVASGIAMITMKNIVHAALMLVTNFVAIAVLYLALETQFLGVVQIIVYAGAIMVLFLFVIMLLGVDRDDLTETKPGNRLAAGFLAVLVAGAAVFAFAGPYTGTQSACGDLGVVREPADSNGDGIDDVTIAAKRDPQQVRCVGLEQQLANDANGSVGFVATRIFTRYTFPFEISGLLLTVATVGAMVLGRRNDDKRVAEYTAPLPTPELPDDLVTADAATGTPNDADPASPDTDPGVA